MTTHTEPGQDTSGTGYVMERSPHPSFGTQSRISCCVKQRAAEVSSGVIWTRNYEIGILTQRAQPRALCPSRSAGVRNLHDTG